MFSTFSVNRLSAGSIYKLMFIGLTSSLIPLGFVFGVLAFFGANTVRWNNEPLHGASGLFAGPLLGVVMALFLSAFLGTTSALGLWLYSKFRPLSLSGKALELQSGSGA